MREVMVHSLLPRARALCIWLEGFTGLIALALWTLRQFIYEIPLWYTIIAWSIFLLAISATESGLFD